MEQLPLQPTASGAAGKRTVRHLKDHIHDRIVEALRSMAAAGPMTMTRPELAAYFSEQYAVQVTVNHIDRDLERAANLMGLDEIDLPIKRPRKKKALPDANASAPHDEVERLREQLDALEQDKARCSAVLQADIDTLKQALAQAEQLYNNARAELAAVKRKLAERSDESAAAQAEQRKRAENLVATLADGTRLKLNDILGQVQRTVQEAVDYVNAAENTLRDHLGTGPKK